MNPRRLFLGLGLAGIGLVLLPTAVGAIKWTPLPKFTSQALENFMLKGKLAEDSVLEMRLSIQKDY